MSAKGDQSGQALVLTVVFLVSLLGMAALVLDVGSWYRSKRQLQSTADAAALAGAQALPDTAGSASGLANQYATANAPDLASADFSISSNIVPNDRITVHVTRPAPGFFAKVFGINSVQVGATATAQTEGMSQAKYVAPIVVNKQHPLLAGAGCPCLDQKTTIPLGKAGAPGAFDLINLDGSRGGTGQDTLASWLLSGYQNSLGLGGYPSDTGAKWNSSEVHDALAQRIGTVLMFPVYDTLTGTGANASYNVIGWVGFYLEDFDARGSSGSITGHFTEVVWDGLQQTTATQTPNFGAHTVQLVD